MACCNDNQHPTTGVQIDYRDLPEETFCCMGRVAYTVSTTALAMITKKTFTAWADLNERQKLELGARAKAFIVGDSDGETEVEKIMATVLRSMTTAI